MYLFKRDPKRKLKEKKNTGPTLTPYIIVLSNPSQNLEFTFLVTHTCTCHFQILRKVFQIILLYDKHNVFPYDLPLNKE